MDLQQNTNTSHEDGDDLTRIFDIRKLLQNNNITCEIPLGIGILHNLQTLDLSINKLFGQVPVSLHLLNSLQYLFVGNPLICGSHVHEGCSGSVTPFPFSFSLNSSSGKRNSKKLAFALGVSLSIVTLILSASAILLWRKFEERKYNLEGVSIV